MGKTTVLADGSPVHLSPKERSVLTALALGHPDEVSVDRLIEHVWGDGVPSTARKAVQTYIAALRRNLGDAIVTVGDAYRLGPPARLDCESFGEHASAAETAIAVDPAGALASAEAALSMVRGVPYGDLAGCPDADSARVLIEEKVAGLRELRGEALIRAGMVGEAVTALEAVVAESPYRERGWWLLMLSLYRGGRRTESLRAFGRARNVLVEDVGLEPGSELQALEAAILADSPLLDEEAVFGRAGTARPPAPGNLRGPEDSFVGRDEELGRLVALLEGATPVVCVVGAAGVGKSRLAVEAALRVAPCFPDGSWLIPLSGVEAGGDVAPVVIDELGIGVAVGSTPLEAFGAWCAEHRGLVVLDTCEHVLDSVSLLADAAARSGSAGSIVITTRSAAGLADHESLRLGPLWVPPLGDEEGPASMLFTHRMGLEALDAETADAVARICHHLEGLPLAIELAASRSTSVSPVEMEQHLDRMDRFLRHTQAKTGRHASLTTALTWSTDLLDAHSARLFDRLSIFKGRFALKSVQEVCGFGMLDEWDVLDSLDRLVSHNLLEYETPTERAGSYRMLDPVRHFAATRLAATGEAPEVVARFGAHYCRLAQEAFAGSRGPDEKHWVAVVRGELANLAAALEHFATAGDVIGQFRLVAPLINYAVVQAFDGVLTMATKAAAALGDRRPPGSGRVLAMSAWAHLRRQDYAAADVLARRAVEAAQQAGDIAAMSEALQMVAVSAYFQGDPVTGRALNEEGARLARSVGDRHGEALNLGLAVMLNSAMDPTGWRETADRVLELTQAIGSPSMLCWGHYTWALSRQTEDPALALAWFDRAVHEADEVDATFYGDLVRRSTVQVLSSLDPAQALRVAVRTTRSQLDSGEQFQVGLSIPWFVTLLARMDRCEAAIVFEEATYRLGDRITAGYLPEARRKALERCRAELEPEVVERARLTGRTIDIVGLVEYAERLVADLEA